MVRVGNLALSVMCEQDVLDKQRRGQQGEEGEDQGGREDKVERRRTGRAVMLLSMGPWMSWPTQTGLENSRLEDRGLVSDGRRRGARSGRPGGA